MVQSCIGTKFISRWADLAVKIAIDAVKKVTIVGEDGSGAKGRFSVVMRFTIDLTGWPIWS